MKHQKISINILKPLMGFVNKGYNHKPKNMTDVKLSFLSGFSKVVLFLLLLAGVVAIFRHL